MKVMPSTDSERLIGPLILILALTLAWVILFVLGSGWEIEGLSGKQLWLFVGILSAIWAIYTFYVAARESKERPIWSYALYVASGILAVELLWPLMIVFVF